MKKFQHQNGFSLIELLVVVIIIGVIAAIAIPSLIASRRAANEASAIQSLRAIHNANSTYFVTSGSNTTYAALTQLSSIGYLDPTFTGASFVKSGYTIAESVNGTSTVYCASAEPVGNQGTRFFGVNERGAIFQGVPAGACANGVLNTTGAAPIQ